MKLSEHFSLAEMTKSQTAIRMGIDNSPDSTQIDSLRNLCVVVLEPIRAYMSSTPFSPSSGFRSVELNTEIGGSKGSQHCLGEAADIEVPGVSNLSLAWWIRSHIDFDQLILEYFNPDDPSSGWVHVSVRNTESVMTSGSVMINRHDTMVYDGILYSKGLPG